MTMAKSFAQQSRQLTRTRGLFSEMYKCEKCNRSIGENYFSLPSPGDSICQKIGIFGLSLCEKCMAILEVEYDRIKNE